MTETEALSRIRALRASGYRCQAEDARGIKCGARAKQVWPLTADGVARCDFHMEELSKTDRVRRRPRLKP